MTAEHDTTAEFVVETRVVPIRKWRGSDARPMTAFEAFVWALSKYIRRPLDDFRWRAKITPALRERCVDYALKVGARDRWAVISEAQKIAEYIAKGES